LLDDADGVEGSVVVVLVLGGRDHSQAGAQSVDPAGGGELDVGMVL
jgi:hypothetical protein